MSKRHHDPPIELQRGMTNEDYRQALGGLCPFCQYHQTQVLKLPYEMLDGRIMRKRLCHGCKRLWLDIFHLMEYEVIE